LPLQHGDRDGEAPLEVAAAVLIDRGRVLVARRKSGPLAGFWEFPGGKVEAGETPPEALRRELEEELGIAVRVGPFLGESVHRDERGAIRLLAFWAAWEGGDMTVRVHDQVRWVEPPDLDACVFAPADRPLVEKLKGLAGSGGGKN